MLRLAANLSTLFPERTLAERFDAAAAAGFRAVEMQFPYALSPAEVRARLDASGQELVLFNAPPGDAARGERGLAGLPDREAEFRDSFALALDYAGATGCPRIHVMAGLQIDADSRAEQLDRFRDNLAFACDRAAEVGVTVMIEPINPVDVPGYLLRDNATAVALMDALVRPNLRLQYDFYHQQIIAGDLARRFDALIDRIGHVQIADNPGRHEPGTGEISYDWLLAHVSASAYDGWVGCEYLPSSGQGGALDWARRHLGR
ncbi:MAG: TIM barrel protein [Steroidobacteraceae bacterium]